MQYYEGVFGYMNAVLYYSNTGESKRIAEYLADKTGFDIFDITKTAQCEFASAVIVFPVYCQNVPAAVNDFLQKLRAENVAVVATYGRASYGNVLNDIQRRYNHKIIAAAYIPTKHAYVDEAGFDRFDELAPLTDKILSADNNSCAVTIPRSRKNPFAAFAPSGRSRIGVKIVRNERCDGCGKCKAVCPQNAIKQGKPNRKCIRCAKCVVSCPHGALTLRLSTPMRIYLNKRKKDEIVIYI